MLSVNVSPSDFFHTKSPISRIIRTELLISIENVVQCKYISLEFHF